MRNWPNQTLRATISRVMRVTIEGTVPSKKNSRNLFVRDGRIVNTPNKAYQTWERDALVQLQSQVKGQADGPVIVTVEIYNKDKRGRDLDNQLSSVMDLLTKSGLIKDDNCFEVSEVHAVFGGVDKESPRCLIDIEEVEPQ